VSFVKTTGGKGLHIVAPIRRTIDWPVLRDFTAHLASRIEGASPSRYTTNSSKRARPGKIYLDSLRNRFGATCVAPYSTRSRPGAPVSTPIEWEELESMRSADSYSVGNLPRRLANQVRDPWAGMADVKQAITQSMIRSVKH
jgi:bifunctional non-homologous end joining protein LigD